MNYFAHALPFLDGVTFKILYICTFAVTAGLAAGLLYELMAPKAEMHQAVVSRLKVMAKLDIAERRLPQAGRIRTGNRVCIAWDQGAGVTRTVTASIPLLQLADDIFIDELRKNDLYDQVSQAFAVFLPVKSVGVMGDGRTYDFACALRAVTSVDGMTADYYPFTHEFLGETATRIINEVPGINRVTYDITSKPPGTIEWE